MPKPEQLKFLAALRAAIDDAAGCDDDSLYRAMAEEQEYAETLRPTEEAREAVSA